MTQFQHGKCEDKSLIKKRTEKMKPIAQKALTG